MCARVLSRVLYLISHQENNGGLREIDLSKLLYPQYLMSAIGTPQDVQLRDTWPGIFRFYLQ